MSAKQGKKGSGGKNRPTTKTAPPFMGRAAVDPWITLGPQVKAFFTDKNIRDAKIEVSITSLNAVEMRLSFTEEDPVKLSVSVREMDRDDYMAHRAARAKALEMSNQESGWANFRAKLKARTLMDLSGIQVPAVRGRPAMSVVLSVLSPQEKDLMDLSQSNWNQASKERLKAFLDPTSEVLSGGGSNLLQARRKYVEARFAGKSDEPFPFTATLWTSHSIRHMPKDAVTKAISPVPTQEGKELSTAAKAAADTTAAATPASSKKKGKGKKGDE